MCDILQKYEKKTPLSLGKTVLCQTILYFAVKFI